MSTQPVRWTGTASIPVLNNATLPYNEWIQKDIDPTKIAVSWNNGSAPDGRLNDTLASTYPDGYQVSYTVQYAVAGYTYVDIGSAHLEVRTVDYKTGQFTTSDVLPPSKGAGLYYYWTYGTVDNSTPYTVPVGVVPKNILYNLQRSNGNHNGYEMYWNIYYTVNVVRDCTVSNITSQICQDLCVANPDQACYINYRQHCLDGEPDVLASDVCTNFYGKWISINGSDGFISGQARRYCSKKYNGFADLLEYNPKIPDAERLKDIQICACNLQAKPIASDPIGTVLYNNYFNALVAKFPGFGLYGSSIEQKCLLPQCASAAFKPDGVGTHCTVPQCINLISITNNGEINGNVVATASCEQTASGENGLSFLTIAVLFFAVILVIFIVIYFFTTPGLHRLTKSERYEPRSVPVIVTA